MQYEKIADLKEENKRLNEKLEKQEARFDKKLEEQKQEFKEQYEKQRNAELRLYNAQAEKLTSDIKKCSDDISKHYMSSVMEISRQQTAADNALLKLNEAIKISP